mmetsp:Transcript_18413/g.31490  ORF Transcript_18413/g.31490 Transcript_18413/m.31490 type:complete len:151 (+) Transcript_18413:102-554(+)
MANANIVNRHSNYQLQLTEVKNDQSYKLNPLEHLFESKREIDSVHGEYPFILYKHYYILKENILDFCQRKFAINQDLSSESIQEVQYLEHLLINHLKIASKLNIEVYEREYKWYSPLASIQKYINWHYVNRFSREILDLSSQVKRNDLVN